MLVHDDIDGLLRQLHGDGTRSDTDREHHLDHNREPFAGRLADLHRDPGGAGVHDQRNGHRTRARQRHSSVFGRPEQRGEPESGGIDRHRLDHELDLEEHLQLDKRVYEYHLGHLDWLVGSDNHFHNWAQLGLAILPVVLIALLAAVITIGFLWRRGGRKSQQPSTDPLPKGWSTNG